MSDIRYIVRDSSILRAAHEDECSIYVNESMARHKREWINRVRDREPTGEIFVVDLDAARPIDRDEYEHAERTWINAYAECLRLRPGVRPEDAICAEIIRLNLLVLAMQDVVEAACAYVDTPSQSDWKDPRGGRDTRVCDAVDAYRARQR